MWFERNEHDRLEELRDGDEPNEPVEMLTLAEVRALLYDALSEDEGTLAGPLGEAIAARCGSVLPEFCSPADIRDGIHDFLAAEEAKRNA